MKLHLWVNIPNIFIDEWGIGGVQWIIIEIILSLLMIMNTADKQTDEARFTALRKVMVKEQIAARGITDPRVLEAMEKVPRHKFLPPHLWEEAYDDGPLPIGYGQTISQPYVVAYMTEQLELTGNEKVLEIGTGSGYQTAILAELAKEVFSIEIVPELGHRAARILKELGYTNVHIRIGDGYRGWPEEAPFDAILLAAAPRHIPQPLLDQLKEGGRMILPVGDFYQDLVLIRKTREGVLKETKIPVRFVPMRGEAEKQKSPPEK